MIVEIVIKLNLDCLLYKIKVNLNTILNEPISLTT